MEGPIAYIDGVVDIINRIRETQTETIEKAIYLMFDRFQAGGSLFVFGASHAGIVAEEMFCRAGGLMVVNPVFSPTLMLNTRPFTVTSMMERLEGFGNIILKGTPIKKGDVLIIHSASGRNAVTIDMAMEAREMGVAVIVITNMDYSTKVSSRHSSGKMLYQLGDVVIDNCGVYGDASVPVGETGIKAGPTSTVAGATIANMIAVGFAQLCDEKGILPPVFLSANADKEKGIKEPDISQYKDRIHYL